MHHIATSLQASTLLRRITRDTVDALDRLFPDEVGEEAAPAAVERARDDVPPSAWRPIPSAATGLCAGRSMRRHCCGARDSGCVIRMERTVGEFVVEGMSLAACFTVAAYRTVQQDAGSGIRQLVDIALKDLSPGINDTTTAVSCVDYLGAVLAKLAGRRIASRARGEDGHVDVIARGPTFASLLGEAVDEIRQNAAGNVSVLARLLEILRWVSEATAVAARRQLVAEHMALVAADAERTVPAEHDRARLRALFVRPTADAPMLPSH